MTPRPSPTAPSAQLALFAQIHEDWIAHGRDWTKPGFRAVAVHRFGVWRMAIRPRAIRGVYSVLYRMLYRHVRNVYGIELPYTVSLGRRVVFEHQHGIVIHGLATIGDECVVRQGVTIGIRRVEALDAVPRLGCGVQVGAGAVIVGPVLIGDRAEIGANAVVLGDVAGGALALGVPAKVVDRS